MFRTAAALMIAFTVSALPAAAADATSEPTISEQASALAANMELVTATAREAMLRRIAEKKDSRPAILPVLYAGSAALQGFDFYSTRRALANGAHEANPMMGGVVKSPVAFATVKAAASVLPMFAAERLWKTNRKAAIVTMVIQNGVMAAVAANNARTLQRHGGR